MKDDDRIPFDLKEYQNQSSFSFSFVLNLNEREKAFFPNLISLGDLTFYVDGLNANGMMSLVLSCEGDISLSDAHDHTKIDYSVDDDVEVIIAPNDEESNDILPDEDGIYDLRGSCLALLFDAIPQNYSLVPLETVVTDDYVLMSEDEYNRRKASKNAFSALDEEDFD